MNSGIYAALSGNITAMKRLDVLSNNLANTNTAGFKKDRLTFESLLAKGQAAGDAPVMAEEKFFTDFSPGPLKQTGNTLDVAIEGDGFFVIDTPQGPAYTRQGNFHISPAGRLVTVDGFEVQGKGGPITIKGGSVDIDTQGGIAVDGANVGALQLVDFPKPYALQKLGNSLYRPASAAAAPQPAAAARVNQGFLEESNVSVVMEMAQMIETSRYFETCQKVIQNYDNMASKAANDVGRL